MPENSSYTVLSVRDLIAETGFRVPLSATRSQFIVTPFSIRRSWKTICVSIVLVALVHLFIGNVLFYGISGVLIPNPIPNRMAAISQGTSEESRIVTLVLLPETPQQDNVTPEVHPSEHTADTSPIVNDDTREERPLKEDAVEEIPASSMADQADKTRTLESIYHDQIRARIERAWMDTKGVKVGIGKCRISIQQDDNGKVMDVEFVSCIATTNWQQQLSRAIYYASPLPAPPDATVFSQRIIMEF